MKNEPSSYSTEKPVESRPVINVETGVSRFDQLSGALIASIALFGFLTAILFLIWVTTNFNFGRELDAAQPFLDSYGDEKPEGYEDDVLEPG